jgi:hypothetical protein
MILLILLVLIYTVNCFAESYIMGLPILMILFSRKMNIPIKIASGVIFNILILTFS